MNVLFAVLVLAAASHATQSLQTATRAEPSGNAMEREKGIIRLEATAETERVGGDGELFKLMSKMSIAQKENFAVFVAEPRKTTTTATTRAEPSGDAMERGKGYVGPEAMAESECVGGDSADFNLVPKMSIQKKEKFENGKDALFENEAEGIIAMRYKSRDACAVPSVDGEEIELDIKVEIKMEKELFVYSSLSERRLTRHNGKDNAAEANDEEFIVEELTAAKMCLQIEYAPNKMSFEAPFSLLGGNEMADATADAMDSARISMSKQFLGAEANDEEFLVEELSAAKMCLQFEYAPNKMSFEAPFSLLGGNEMADATADAMDSTRISMQKQFPGAEANDEEFIVEELSAAKMCLQIAQIVIASTSKGSEPKALEIKETERDSTIVIASTSKGSEPKALEIKEAKRSKRFCEDSVTAMLHQRSRAAIIPRA